LAIRVLRRDPLAVTIDVECPNARCKLPVRLAAVRVQGLLTEHIGLVALECPGCQHRFDVSPTAIDGPIWEA
jgi:hypothetical protein